MLTVKWVLSVGGGCSSQVVLGDEKIRENQQKTKRLLGCPKSQVNLKRVTASYLAVVGPDDVGLSVGTSSDDAGQV